MAKINKGILGAFSGKVGPVIGGTWKGIPYIREVPAPVKRKSTAAQIESRQKLIFMNNLLVPFHPYITIGFMHQAVHKTEISAAFSKNYHQAVIGQHPNYSVIYSEFVISMGDLPMVADVAMELLSLDTIRLTWAQNRGKKTAFNDQLMLALYCPELQRADGFVGGVKRATQHCTFQFNPKMAGKRLEVFLSITAMDRKRIANSQYLGHI